MLLAAQVTDEAEDFKTIGEVSSLLKVPQHVLRFWEGQFPQIKPVKRKGGRRFYAPKDVEILERIRTLLYTNAYTIKGAKKALNQSFIPGDDLDMRKKSEKKHEDQIDIFEMIEKTGGKKAEAANANNASDKQTDEGLRKILQSLKEIQILLAAG